ncbi:MAG: hypothetical protein KatS3mg057_0034 [Herpetosiphonaceae bacterium]|nr:MAG: hypothetical protein KatS3mg057_0034 [Herpetosiphonaceae bacterium]
MAGIGVGQGYLGDPRKTAAAFVPNPFGGPLGSRLYLTGDMGRWREDGQLDFLGRTDGQVKVRGHRIELGEVEAALVRCQSVRHAVAIVRPDAQNQLRLLGYVVGEPDLDPRQVREELGRLVPRSMIPDHIMVLDQMPLNPNGKVDRRALPMPADDQPIEAVSEPPRTPIEEIVAETWCQVLGLTAIGRHDNFFERGGHSLLATQVMTRLRQALSVELPLRAIFEQPTVAGLSSRIAALRQSTAGDPRPPLQPVPREQPLPLSFAQQRLWIMDQLVPDSPLYTMPLVIRLTGKLDRAALMTALDGLIVRHESLRTRIDTLDGEPIQIVDAPAPCPLLTINMRDRPAAERDTAADSAIRAFIVEPFDLRSGPLFRAQLIELDDDQHLLTLVLHHIITDGWSSSVLLRDLTALYEAALAGVEPALPALPIQYADFAVWQRAWLQGETLERQISYWRRQLEGIPALLNLPTDHPRPAVQSFRGATLKGVFPASLTKALRALSRAEGTTLFMTLLAGYQALLAAYSGQKDILVGVPIAGRVQPEVEGLIGFFVNTLVMRTSFHDDLTIRELLASVRDTALDAYTHQDVPFEQLVEVLQPERTLSHTPIFQVAFALQNTPQTGAQLADLTLDTMEEGDLGVAKFDLMVSLRELPGDELAFVVEYSTDLFEEMTIRRMLDHYQRLLSAMAEDPDQAVAAIDMLSQMERTTILNTWNETYHPYPATPVYTWVAEQATRTPETVAVCVGTEQRTYRQLLDDTYRLAHVLKARGVRRGDRVGIFLTRQAHLISALLAVHAAGAAYVPLDPTYPLERLALMAEDAGLRLIISETALAERLAGISPVLDLTAVESELASQPATAPECHLTPDDLAYVMYTSGSTGRPKGVAIPHRGLSSFVAWCKTSFAKENFAGVLVSTSICFDLSVFEIFVPLSCGGTIILVENGLHMPPSDHQPPITMVNLVPSVIAEVLQQGTLPSTVRVVNLGGEASHQQLVDQIYAQTSVQRVYNVYGPTEDTVYSTWSLLEPGGQVLIGRPIWNTQAYILDSAMRPVPIGVTGELYLGGDGQAWGYFGQPALTADRFVPNPFSRTPGTRLYRTGDLARFLPDGAIEYLGRADYQVKIRGFRIELGEIEAVLHEHPSIYQAVTAFYPGQGSSAQSRIAAYVVAKPGYTLDTAALRAHLQKRLPDYMIPSAFVAMDELPLTPNGKINRRALPKPDEGSLLRAPYVAPRTPTEEAVAELWSRLLGVEKVGMDDNFFLLGGHSLLATQLLAQIQLHFGVQVTLRSFFESPTAGALAQQVDTLLNTSDDETDELDELLDLVEGLSDAEVAELLARRSRG